MIMPIVRASMLPNAAAESRQLIRASLTVRVRNWEELPENERQERYTGPWKVAAPLEKVTGVTT